jgi:hypothetical protein
MGSPAETSVKDLEYIKEPRSFFVLPPYNVTPPGTVRVRPVASMVPTTETVSPGRDTRSASVSCFKVLAVRVAPNALATKMLSNTAIIKIEIHAIMIEDVDCCLEYFMKYIRIGKLELLYCIVYFSGFLKRKKSIEYNYSNRKNHCT